jgi:tRNA modification GTPase
VTPTLLACLTPPGRAALATLALFGPRAWDAARARFRLRSGAALPERPQPGRFWLGRVGGEVGDEAVLAVRQVEPVPWLEVHCHGGPEVIRFLTELFAAEGLQPVPWQDFLRHTEADLLRAAAAVALAEAPTTRTAAILLDQHEGAFAEALAAIEAALQRGEVPATAALLDELAARIPLGRHLTVPWRVTVAGAPNVGKSSLVNALAGYQRSIVAATPGTTRDVVTVRLAIDGWPVELADTAGLRSEAEELEGQGITQARAAAAGADLCLWLLDASTAPVWPGPEHGSQSRGTPAGADTPGCPEHGSQSRGTPEGIDRPGCHGSVSRAGEGNVRLVVNKIDLPPAWDLAEAGDAVRVSAQTGAGLAELCAALSRWLVPEPPAPGAAVPFTPALAEALEEARRQLVAGRAAEAQKALHSRYLGGTREQV